MIFKSIPAVTSESALGAEMLRDKSARKQTVVDQQVTAVVAMHDAHLSLEHEPGRMLPRPVLYMNGTVRGIKGNALPDGVEYCRLSDDPEEQTMRGTDVYVRYEFSDLQAARAMTRGVGRRDWTGLDQRLLTNAHELPMSCDITLITTKDSQLPFIVIDVNDRMGLTYNRKTSGYDYADLVGISPSLMREANPQMIQQLDQALKSADYQAMMAQSQRETERKTREVKPTHYEQRVFDDIFGAEAERAEAERAQREREASDKEQHPTPAKLEAEPSHKERSLGVSAVDDVMAEREKRRQAATAEDIEKAREEAQKAAEAAGSMSLFDSIADEIVDEDEREGGLTETASRAVKAERTKLAEAVSTAPEDAYDGLWIDGSEQPEESGPDFM